MNPSNLLCRWPRLATLFLALVSLSPLHAQLNPMLYGSAPGQSANNGGTLRVAEGEYIQLSVYNYPGGSSIQWLRDETVLPDEGDPWLELDPVELRQAGVYRARIVFNSQTASTPAVTVAVLSGLVITQSPVNPVLKGTSVTLSASAPGAGELRNYAWRHRGTVVPGVISPTLRITSADFVSAGEFTVEALFVTLGRTVRSPRHNVDVYSRFEVPVIVSAPRPAVARPDGPAFVCIGVSGTAPFTYQWRFQGNDLEGQTNFFIHGDHVTTGHAGNYDVVVRNVAGSITSAPVSLTVTMPPVPNATASSLVSSGRAALTVHTNTSLSAATATFGAALGLDSNHPLANLFFGITRIADVIHQTPANQFMDRLQLESTRRDIYDWSANWPEQPNGDPVIPAGVNASEFPAFARDHYLPEIRGALANLARITDAGFTADLTAAETLMDAITLDQADLHVVRAGLGLLEFWVRTLNSWNLSAKLTDVHNLGANDLLSIERMLADYPTLLTYADAGQAGPARTALALAIDDYVHAAALMRGRSPEAMRLFSLDPEDLDQEADFRQFLLDLKASLDRPVFLNASAARAPGIEDATQYEVQVGVILDGNHSLRSLMPSFHGNQPDAATLADPTFGGMLRSSGPPQILLSPIDLVSRGDSPAMMGVAAMGAPPLRYQWYRNWIPIPSATNSILELTPEQIAAGGNYDVVVQNALGEAWSDQVTVVLVRSATLSVTLSGGTITLTLAAPPGGTWVIQSSEDLRVWTTLQTLPDFSGGATVTDAIIPARPARFYRAKKP